MKDGTTNNSLDLVFFLSYLLFINILFELFRIMILRVSSLISHYIPRHVFIFFFIWNCYFNINCYTLSFDAIVAHGQKDINSYMDADELIVFSLEK